MTCSFITDNNGKTQFNANDIGKILEFKSFKKIIEKYVPDKYKKIYKEIDVEKTYNKKYQNKSVFITEHGIYILFIKNKINPAIKFQHYITTQLLQHIRKNVYLTLDHKFKFKP